MGMPLCLAGGDPQSGCLPSCAGDTVTPGTQPLTRGHFKGPSTAACSVGKWLRAGPGGAGSSREMLLGRGHCRRMSPHQAQDGRWGLGFASSLFIPQVTCLVPSPHGYSGVGVALGQEAGLGQGKGSAPHRDQPSCALGNSLGQQT